MKAREMTGRAFPEASLGIDTAAMHRGLDQVLFFIVVVYLLYKPLNNRGLLYTGIPFINGMIPVRYQILIPNWYHAILPRVR